MNSWVVLFISSFGGATILGVHRKYLGAQTRACDHFIAKAPDRRKRKMPRWEPEDAGGRRRIVGHLDGTGDHYLIELHKRGE